MFTVSASPAGFHLEKQHMLLTARAVQMVHYMFSSLLFRDEPVLDDVGMVCFMQSCTDLPESEVRGYRGVLLLAGGWSVDHRCFVFACRFTEYSICSTWITVAALSSTSFIS